MTTWEWDRRYTRLFRVRRCDPATGEVRETRYYAREPAARARAARWAAAGWRVSFHYAGPVRFQGPRP